MKTTQIQKFLFAQFRPIIYPFDGYYVIFAQTYYVGALSKFLMYAINYLHKGHELEKIFFFQFQSFSWLAAISAHFTAGAKIMPTPNFFSNFMLF